MAGDIVDRGLQRGPTLGDRLRPLAETFGTVLVALLLLLAFSQTSDVFLQSANVRNILIQISVVGVAAIGETIVMLVGGIDLSVGANVLLSSVIIADLVQRQHQPLAVAIIAGIAAATAVGVVNGVLTAVIGIEPILATLGTLLLAAGTAKVILASGWIIVDDTFFADLAQHNVVLNLPIMVVLMLVLYALVAFGMRLTPFGRMVYAVGGNPASARLSGLSVTRVKILAFALGGLFAGIAGLLEVAQLGIVSQGDATGMEFRAITAALIGGLSVTAGGIGRVERTLVGALIVGMLANYQTIRGVSPTYQDAVLGGILLLAVVTDRLIRGRPS
jgi:ribose/xylose/arabinose/galactoside ABC-type transport system permease subunit